MSASGPCCTKCSPPRTFEDPEQERRHHLEYHSESFTVTVTAESGKVESIVVTQIDGVYICPRCGKPLTSKTGCRKHLKNKTCPTEKDKQDPPEPAHPATTIPTHLRKKSRPTAKDNQDLPESVHLAIMGPKHLKKESCPAEEDSQDPLEPVHPAIMIPKHQDIPSLPEPRQQLKSRSFDDAVLYSCGEFLASHRERQKTLGIVEALDLKPISIKDHLGIEQNVLAHPSVILRLPKGPTELNPIVAQKRKLTKHA